MQFAKRMAQDQVRYLKNQSSTSGVIGHIEEFKFRTVRKGRPQVTLQSQKLGTHKNATHNRLVPCKEAYTN
jgi:hypothetical protein